VKLDLKGMIQDIESLPDDTVVLLQPCGHNPTGIDPSTEEWDELLKVFLKRPKLFPFFDTAYLGFASGNLDRDRYPMKLFNKNKLNMVCTNSFAKNFGL